MPRALSIAACAAALLLAACASESADVDTSDAASADASDVASGDTAAEPDAPDADAGNDDAVEPAPDVDPGPDPEADAGADAETELRDAAPDTTVDTGADAASDATAGDDADATDTADVAADAAADIAGDEGDTGAPDAAPDDASPDAAADSGPDADPACAAGTGTRVGDVARTFALPDCDGVMHDLADACGSPATLILSYTGWCPPCQTKAGLAQAVWERIGADGARMYFVVAEDSSFGAPTAAYCDSVRSRFGLGMTVLYDRDGLAQDALGIRANDEAVVVDAELRIAYTEQYASMAAIEAAVNAVLAP
jgi:peroxiredoxin